MSLFLKHSEDNTWHTYQLKDRRYFWIWIFLQLLNCLILLYLLMNPEHVVRIAASIINSGASWEEAAYTEFIIFLLPFAFWIFMGIIIEIDFAIMNIRNTTARFLGNKVIETGSYFYGKKYQIKIEKKGMKF